MAIAKTRLFSSALGMCVDCQVILPQRRDAAAGHRLPVLWLLHGAFGGSSDWLRRTNIERYAAPYGLAVVMPSAQNSAYTDMAHGGRYYTYISQELPRALQQLFNFSDRREDQFIAGLSMGGAGSLMIGLSQPEKYAAIGCLSAGAISEGAPFRRDRRWEMTFGAAPLEGTYKDMLGNARKILEERLPRPRIFHACGAEDFLLSSARATRDFFTALPGNPFDYQYVEAPGAHTWEFWDTHIASFIEFLGLPRVNGEYI